MRFLLRKTEPADGHVRRLAGLDLARGLAVVAMVLYHLSWDLGYFHVSPVELAGSPLGRLCAHIIAMSFLALVGISLVLAQQSSLFQVKFWRRLAIIGISAAAISGVTFWIMPESWIFFGILHCIFVSSLIGFGLLDAPVLWLIGLSLAAITLPLLIANPIFDPLPLVWIGLGETVPPTNDFAPLFPSLGAVLAGMVLAKLKWQDADVTIKVANDNAPKTAAPWAKRALLWCGRHSLIIYLIHQPVLFGAFSLAYSAQPQTALFETECQSQCMAAGTAPKICIPACACMKQRLKSSGLWTKMMREPMDSDDEARISDMALICGESAKAHTAD